VQSGRMACGSPLRQNGVSSVRRRSPKVTLFRAVPKAVSGVADEIESLRAIVLKQDTAPIGSDLKSTRSYRYRQLMSKRT